LETVAEILAESFANVRSKGKVIGTSTAEEADFLGISPGHLSRIRNERVPLTDDVIDKIVFAFTKGDRKRSDLLRERLTQAKMVTHSRIKVAAGDKRLATLPSLFSEYSVQQVGTLFQRLSVPNSLLAVDYRDLPQARKKGRYPKFALAAAEAIKKGLSFALFQPFGSAEKILEKEAFFRESFPAQPNARPFLDACHYLFDLATGVREVYEFIKFEAERDGRCEGSIVLYEAVRLQDGKEVPLSLAACGIQSRLFYADYSDSLRHYREVYEWVVTHPDSDCFVQREEASINLAAVKTQFSPIIEYWEKDKTKLPVGKQVAEAYADFFDPLFGKEARLETKWRDWPRKP
jgi:hypothetical protein